METKKIKVLLETLISQNAVRMDLGRDLHAIKISFAEAMAFAGNFNSFEEMLAHYGCENRLQPEEEYSGYLAVYYTSCLQLPIFMDGKLRKATISDVCGTVESYVLDAPKEGRYWVLEARKDVATKPAFYEVYNWQRHDFVKHINDISNEGYIEVPNAEAMAQNLKKKIFDGVVSGQPFELTKTEFIVLETYEGAIDLRQKFIVF